MRRLLIAILLVIASALVAQVLPTRRLAFRASSAASAPVPSVLQRSSWTSTGSLPLTNSSGIMTNKIPESTQGGNALLLAVSARSSSSAPVIGVGDNIGNVWTKACFGASGHQFSSGVTNYLWIWLAQNAGKSVV